MASNKVGIKNPKKYPKLHDAREVRLYDTLKNDRNSQDDFKGCDPVVSACVSNGTTPLPAEAAVGQIISFQTDRLKYEMYYAVGNSTGTMLYSMPYLSADGLEITLDADNTDGATAIEFNNGTTARSRNAYTIGTDPAFFFEATLKIDDISDLEEIFMGFRKAEAYQADPDDYDEAVGFHIGETGATVADGQINLFKILNNAATSYVDTTETDWADAGEHTLRVEVSQQGVVTWYYDNLVPVVSSTFTFDNGEVVLPFLYLDATTGSTNGDPGVSISSWKCGWIADNSVGV
jgi:hypothetical protein